MAASRRSVSRRPAVLRPVTCSRVRTPPLPASPSGSRFSVLTHEMVPHLAVVASDSGIVFRGEKGPTLDQISALCAKERFEGALDEARAFAAREEPSTSVHPVPGHRETRDGGAPPIVGGIVAPRDGLPLSMSPRDALLPVSTPVRPDARSVGRLPDLLPQPGDPRTPSARGRRGRPPKDLPHPAIDGQASSAPLAGPRYPDEVIK